ncbi:energy transducer TonB [Maribacter sp. 2307ULW6-5]|uniref:energy transducer TonB n=1 Tax=Maribacter sp. 2307ULW6-5 TaxID=3386275 RepID=UPI0039BD46F9
MELKKNPQADLNRNSGLYFVIGLTIVLFTTWQLLEYKTYDTQKEYAQTLDVMDTMDEEVPITELTMNTPPPPPAAPDVIEIVEDLEEIEETTIESTESTQETMISDVVQADDVDFIEEEEDISVPFAIIENVPVFPGCEDLATEEEKKACFNKSIQQHVRDNFQYPKTAIELGISGKVFVSFVVQSDGTVGNIRYRGPDRILEEEGARIIALLPKMKPGIQRGRPVKVPYSIPINFVMQ